MTRRETGSSWSRTWSKLVASPWLRILLVAAGLGVVVEIGRRALVGRSIDQMNLRVRLPLQEIEHPRPNERVIIFAPHEDDETLGCGGYIQRAAAEHSDAHLVLMTNGEYPEIDVILFEETLRLEPKEFIRLGYMRQRETLAAMNYLGMASNAVTFLGYPNQYLTSMWLPAHWLPTSPVRSQRTQATRSPYHNSMTPQAIYCGESMLHDVETILLRRRPQTVITLHPSDIHVDHWPTYAVVRFALEELAARGEAFASDCRIYSYLIHRNYWPVPAGYHPWIELEPPLSLALTHDTDWRALELTRDETIRKHRAIGLYRTQGGNYDQLLRSFARRNDLFGIVPVHDWPSESDVEPIVVSRDPVSDVVTSEEDPSSDILEVTLGRRQNRFLAAISTKGRISDRTTYHISIHAGGADPSDRLVAHYQWQGAKASGAIMRNGRLSEADPGDIRVSEDRDKAQIEAPWLVDPAKSRFFMVRAWTTHGRLIRDTTATETFRLTSRT